MKKLYRSNEQRLAAGVCGGIAELLGFDVSIVRLAWLLLTLATGVIPGVITYLVAWLIVPEQEGGELRTLKLYRSATERKIAGICGGVGESINVDPTIVRLIVVFAALMTAIFPVVLGYLIAWLIIPLKVDEAAKQARDRRDNGDTSKASGSEPEPSPA